MLAEIKSVLIEPGQQSYTG